MPFACALVMSVSHHGALMALAALVGAVAPIRIVSSGSEGRALIPALAGTGKLLLLYALLLSAGLVIFG